MIMFEVTVKQKAQVATLRCNMGVRYWEDGEVNGLPDNDEDPQMPFAEGESWRIDIDLASGKIAGWPEGTLAKTHYKVCDAGQYSLLDAEGNVVAQKEGYVPAMLDPGGDGYGDYVILEIGSDGRILNWDTDFDYFEDDDA